LCSGSGRGPPTELRGIDRDDCWGTLWVPGPTCPYYDSHLKKLCFGLSRRGLFGLIVYMTLKSYLLTGNSKGNSFHSRNRGVKVTDYASRLEFPTVVEKLRRRGMSVTLQILRN